MHTYYLQIFLLGLVLWNGGSIKHFNFDKLFTSFLILIGLILLDICYIMVHFDEFFKTFMIAFSIRPILKVSMYITL